MPKVLALDVVTYCVGRQAHKSLTLEPHGGPDGAEVSSMGDMAVGNGDFSRGDLGMASQLRFPLLCETCSILGTSDYSYLCSLELSSCAHLDGSVHVVVARITLCCVSPLHRESVLLFIAAELPG